VVSLPVTRTKHTVQCVASPTVAKIKNMFTMYHLLLLEQNIQLQYVASSTAAMTKHTVSCPVVQHMQFQCVISL